MIKKRLIALFLMISVVFSIGIISSANEVTKTIAAGKSATYNSKSYSTNISQRITAQVTYIRYNGLPAGAFQTSGTTCYVKDRSETYITAFGLNSMSQKTVAFYVQNTGTHNFGARNNTDKSVELKIKSTFSNY